MWHIWNFHIGDQPPTVYEEEVETEPGIGEYEAPEEPPKIVLPPPRSSPPVSESHRSRYEHIERKETVPPPPTPVATEYHRRYEHEKTVSRIVSGQSNGLVWLFYSLGSY